MKRPQQILQPSRTCSHPNDLGRSCMSHRRLKAITTLAVLVAALAMGGTRSLPVAPVGSPAVNTRAPVAAGGPHWWCDSPDCALLTVPVLSGPPQLTCGPVAAAPLLLSARFEDFPHYIRPPPAMRMMTPMA